MALGRKPIEIVEEGKHQLLTKAKHWDRVYLGKIAKIQNGYAFSSKNFSKDEGVPLIRIRDIDKQTTVDKFNGKYNEEFIVKKGDILIGMDGDFNAARWKGENALLNQRVCRIIPSSENYNDKFLFLCLQPYLNAIHAETSAVTVKHISSKTIEEIPLPFPPIEEQNRIVSKIEELFSELDQGIADLKTAQVQLKVYRQSVLKYAFEGDWKVFNIKDVTIDIFAGGDKPKEYSEFKNEKFPFPIYANAVAKKGLFGFTNLARVKEECITIAGRGSGTGHIELRTEPFLPIVRLIVIIPNKKIITSKYLYYYLKNLTIVIEGSAIPQLTIPTVKEYFISVPPLEEQHLIVQEIESRLSVADKMEESIQESLQKAEALRQSVLKKAFSGELV